MKHKAIIYTRVSTDEQAEKGTSLASQLSACLKHAEQMTAEVFAHYQDAGVSGAFYDTRPGIQAAISDIESGAANILIVYSMSRLSRDRAHQSDIKKRVQLAGGKIVYCDMPVEDTPEGDLLANITGDFAEYERKLFLKRTATGRRRRAEEGVQPCRSERMQPFGYSIPTKQDAMNGLYRADQIGKYVIVEERAAWVRQIFARYASGESLRAVARFLNEANVPTPRQGQYWRVSTIKRIMENPVYRGEAFYGRQKRESDERLIALGYTKGFRQTKRDKADWVSIPAPAIVDAATWGACNERRTTANQVYGGRPDRKHLLTGLLKCPVCKRTMSGNRRERMFKGQLRVTHKYFCRDSRASRNPGKVVCSSKHYTADKAEQTVLNVIRTIAKSPELATAALLAYQSDATKDVAKAALFQTRKSLTEIAAKEKATIEAQIRGIQAGANSAIYEGILAEISAQRSELTSRLAELERAVGTGLEEPEAQEVAVLMAQALADVEEALNAPELTVAEKHNLLARVVTEVFPEGEKGDEFAVLLRKPSGVGNSETVATIRIL